MCVLLLLLLLLLLLSRRLEAKLFFLRVDALADPVHALLKVGIKKQQNGEEKRTKEHVKLRGKKRERKARLT